MWLRILIENNRLLVKAVKGSIRTPHKYKYRVPTGEGYKYFYIRNDIASFFIGRNQRLINKVAIDTLHKYSLPMNHLKDLVQEIKLGIRQKLDESGVKPQNKPWTQMLARGKDRAVNYAQRQRALHISQPREAYRKLTKLEGLRNKFIQANGREPHLGEMAQKLGCSSGELSVLLSTQAPAVSIETPMRGTEEKLTVAETMRAEGPSPEEEAIAKERKTGIANLLAGLSPIERDVVESTFGLGDKEPEALKDICGRLETSASQVKRILEQAKEKLKKRGIGIHKSVRDVRMQKFIEWVMGE